MFGMFEDLTKAALNIVVTPIAVVADVATLGGVLTDREETYTEEQLRKAKENFDKATD